MTTQKPARPVPSTHRASRSPQRSLSQPKSKVPAKVEGKKPAPAGRVGEKKAVEPVPSPETPARKETGRQANAARKPAPAGPDLTPPQDRLENLLRLIGRFQRYGRELSALAIITISLITLLALLGLTGGSLLNPWAQLLRTGFGWGSLILVVAGVLCGFFVFPRKSDAPLKIPWLKIIFLEGSAFSGMVLLTLAGGSSLERAEQGLDGGAIGWGLAELLRIFLSLFGFHNAFWQYLVVDAVFLVCAVIGLGLDKPIRTWMRRIMRLSSPAPTVFGEPDAVISLAPIGEDEQAVASLASRQGKKRVELPAEYRKKFRIQPEAEKSGPPPQRDERLPPLELLSNEQSNRPDERNINLTAGLIEKTLAEFGIPAKVVGFRVGPTVTQFAVVPGFMEKGGIGEENSRQQKVRVAQIAGLQRDLALALSAERLRIEAPVPGRPYVGIEVPNTRSSVVRLRPILENEAFYRVGSQLAIAFGRDVSGLPVVADLGSMPHLLIAGTTGSGKSVCIEALTACLVMNNTPEDLRLVMIDPKMVELVRFNGLPHLLGKVETDIQRIMGVLHWTVAEMDRRYKLLEEMNARHLESYNRKVRRRKGGEPLPRIVVLIDELADLMMTSPDQTEPTLVRLAQLARATGIHLVVATQRPSTDVVTGLIKANFPARISFAVASSIDSRVILDTSGAESLLGRGDMLFMPPEASAPIRSQGVMITDQEIERVITFWQKTRPSENGAPPPWEQMLAEEEVMADRDDLVNKAIEVVKQTGKCSASLLQRRLRIGFPRAARLVEELEELGIVGPAGAGRDREVLVDREEGGNEDAEDE